MQLTFATRPSALARWQTRHVIEFLEAIHPGLHCKEYILTTTGDRELDTPIPNIGSKGIFTGDLENALRSGVVDVAVHSLKDLPVEATPGIVLAAIPKRESAFDVLAALNSWTLLTLPAGARVGTCSLRRSAQLLARRPDLTVVPLRGNVDTRLKNLLQGDYDAIVLAQTGLIRLGLQSHISEVLPLDIMLPAPGQGALAVQCREGDAETQEIIASIHDSNTAAAIDAERSFLSGVGAGCAAPVAAFAEKNNGTIILTGAVLSQDGKQAIRLSAVDRDPLKLGQRLAELVLERGAAELLKVRV